MLKLKTEFSCVHVAAIDASMTELEYAEIVNCSGIDSNDIGQAVLAAISKLDDITDGITVTVRFSHDT